MSSLSVRIHVIFPWRIPRTHLVQGGDTLLPLCFSKLAPRQAETLSFSVTDLDLPYCSSWIIGHGQCSVCCHHDLQILLKCSSLDPLPPKLLGPKDVLLGPCHCDELNPKA